MAAAELVAAAALVAVAALVAANILLVEQHRIRRLELPRVSMQAVPGVSL